MSDLFLTSGYSLTHPSGGPTFGVHRRCLTSKSNISQQQVSYHEVKSIKTDRYQTQTVNINPRSSFRYPKITWTVADVGIPNRYQPKAKPHLSILRNGVYLYPDHSSLII